MNTSTERKGPLSRFTILDATRVRAGPTAIRTFADLGHRQPDGICADAEGAIWTGCFNTGEFLRVLDGGEITDRITFDGCGVACTLGGPDNHTLFCTVYCGPVDDLIAGKRKAAVFTLTVSVGAP